MKHFFSKARQKTEQADSLRNEYYEKVSQEFGFAQVILYSLLFVFVVFSFFRNTHLITYRNFYHFFKDLGAATDTFFQENVESVSYPTNSEQSFALYRDGLAVAGNSSVTIFTASGRQTVSQTVSYQNPVAIGSGKYLLVYELGGTHYSLYNSYAQIFAGIAEYPISGAAVSDSGMYALITPSAQHTSVVSLYNERFALVNRYQKNGHVMDVSIDEKGSLLSILTLYTENGSPQSELMICEPGKTEARTTLTLGDTLGWRCLISSSRVTLLHRAGVICYSTNGTPVNRYDFSESSVEYALLDRNGAALCLNDPSNSLFYRLLVFDRNGKVVYNEILDRKPLSLARCGDSVYWANADGITRLELGKKTLSDISCDPSKKILLALGEDEVLLCSPQKGVYLSFP